jgi:hypothetical protein
VYTECPFHSDGVSTDIVLLCDKATMFRETIKAILNCVYQWKMMKSFVHVKRCVLWSSILTASLKKERLKEWFYTEN